jgi:hypothetical protein
MFFKSLSVFVTAGAAALALAGTTRAAVTGPMYPPPGGVTLVSSGTGDANAGGATWTYSNFAPADLSYGLYWGKSSSTPVGLSLDGGGISGGENMVFNGFAGNVATWSGQTSIFVSNGFGYSQNIVSTRFTLTVSDLSNAPINFVTPASVDITFPSAANAVIPVTGNYKALRKFEVFYGGNWQPAYDLYNSLNTDPGRSAQKSFGAGFYVPEPTSLAALAIFALPLMRRRCQS